MKILNILLYYLFCFSASKCLLAKEETLTLWISSFQDQTYYEQMAELYATKIWQKYRIAGRSLRVQGDARQTGGSYADREGALDLVQLDETFLEYFSTVHLLLLI